MLSNFKPGQIVELRTNNTFGRSRLTCGTGIVVSVEDYWVNVSWSWADGKVGKNHKIDLILVNK